MAQNIKSGQIPADRSKGLKKESRAQMPLERRNFIMMAIAGAMIVAGFLLMLGDSSSVEGFNPDIFSTRRIVVGPLITFLGFIFMGAAIIIRPQTKGDEIAEQ